MKKEIKMPSFGDGTDSAVLCAWLKEPGESYRKGEALCEIEAKKVVSQLEAESDGVLVRQLAEEGDEVAVNEALCEVEV